MTRCVDFEIGASDFGVRVGLTVGKGVGYFGSSKDQTLILHFELSLATI